MNKLIHTIIPLFYWWCINCVKNFQLNLLKLLSTMFHLPMLILFVEKCIVSIRESCTQSWSTHWGVFSEENVRYFSQNWRFVIDVSDEDVEGGGGRELGGGEPRVEGDDGQVVGEGGGRRAEVWVEGGSHPRRHNPCLGRDDKLVGGSILDPVHHLVVRGWPISIMCRHLNINELTHHTNAFTGAPRYISFAYQTLIENCTLRYPFWVKNWITEVKKKIKFIKFTR